MSSVLAAAVAAQKQHNRQKPVYDPHADPMRHVHDEHYERLRRAMQQRIDAAVGLPVFTTDATGLYDAFLQALPKSQRQHHDCHACRAFVERYGGLATLAGTELVPLLWPTSDDLGIYGAAAARGATLVRKADITGVFVNDIRHWGTPAHTDKHGRSWTHFEVVSGHVHSRSMTGITAGQRAAQLREDYDMLSRSLAEYPLDVCRQAHGLLASGQFYRGDKHVDQAAWLVATHEQATAARRWRSRVIWRAVAQAPAGWCHLRSGMLGTLLDDIVAGKSIATIKQNYKSKMDPTQYLRPTAAPTAGNIAAAERLVAELGITASLARRFARLEDCEAAALWTPVKPTRDRLPALNAAAVFAHLRPRPQPREIPGIVAITFAKFRRDVLPTAEAIELSVPASGNFVALVTAVDPLAPPILQWDRPEQRNPVSLYCYVTGSDAARWNLTRGGWSPVTAIVPDPRDWYAFDTTSTRAVFLLENCRDTGHYAGGGFFPETLRSALHAVRSTLEAHARSAPIAGRSEATACGLAMTPTSPVVVRVSGNGVRTTYRIDRWD